VTGDLRSYGDGILTANNNGLAAQGVKILMAVVVLVTVLVVLTLVSKKRRFHTLIMSLCALVVAAIVIVDVIGATGHFIADFNRQVPGADMGALVEQGIYSVAVGVGPWVVLAGSVLILLGVATRLWPAQSSPVPVPSAP